MRLTLALAERDPDSIDSFFGPAAWRDEARRQRLTIRQIQESAQALLHRVAADKGPRADFLARQLRALAARAELLAGVRRPFAEESRLLFGVGPPPIDRTRVAAARASLDRLVPGRGDLTRRLGAVQSRFVVPPDRVPAVFSRAIEECRAITARHVTLPADERVAISEVRELQWIAFTRYEGGHRSRITINTSAAFTVDDLLQLACHESYPGHHVINVLVDDSLVRAAHRLELTVQLLFSPQALLAEGAASIAPQLAFSDAERVEFERRVLCPLAGVDPKGIELSVALSRLVEELSSVRSDIAVRYVDGDLEFARAAAALEQDALIGSPDVMLRFLNEYRTYSVAYARGPDLAAAYITAHASDGDLAARWRTYVQLAARPDQAFAK